MDDVVAMYAFMIVISDNEGEGSRWKVTVEVGRAFAGWLARGIEAVLRQRFLSE